MACARRFPWCEKSEAVPVNIRGLRPRILTRATKPRMPLEGFMGLMIHQNEATPGGERM